MNTLLLLIPVALGLGALGLGAFIWSLNSGQYEDLEGASQRILQDDEGVKPPQDSASKTYLPNLSSKA
jgi:cbb3-type cytochrome oxidase maturation protein